jgi:hypothetical protein
MPLPKPFRAVRSRGSLDFALVNTGGAALGPREALEHIRMLAVVQDSDNTAGLVNCANGFYLQERAKICRNAEKRRWLEHGLSQRSRLGSPSPRTISGD